MSAIKIYKANVGTCYTHQADNRYLGQFLRTDSRVRNSSAGSAGQTLAPIYVFKNETIGDNYPADMVIPVPCGGMMGGRRKTLRRSKNRRSKHSRRRKSQ
jgi:hypothetical protein